MDKRKGIIMAVFALLLVGTGSFVFANPSDRLEDNERPGVIDNSNSGNRGTTTPTSSPRPSSTPIIGNIVEDENQEPVSNIPVGGNQVVGNQTTGNQNGLRGTAQNAGNAVANVVNQVDTKNDDVQKTTASIERLSYLAKNAKNKNDIASALAFRENEKLLEQINQLPDDAKKQELLEALEEISKILEDNTPPVVLGVSNEQITNQAVSITVEDQNHVTILLDGVETTKESLKNITAEGKHELIIIDDAYNETRLTFTIDKTAPTASISYSNQNWTNQDVVVQLVNPSEEIKIINNDGKNSYTFQENGTFQFEIEDIAGNRQTITAVVSNIDKTAPVYQDFGILNSSALEQQKDVHTATVGDVLTAFVTFDEKLAGSPKITFNNQVTVDATLAKEENGLYTYVASYTVNDTEFVEGVVSVQVSDYYDAASNVGKTLTNLDLTNGEYKEVTIILEPGFEFVDGSSFSNDEIVIKEPDYDYMEVCQADGTSCIRVDGNSYQGFTLGTYRFKIHYKGSSEVKEFTMTYDNSKPEITAHTSAGGEIADKYTLYDSVTLNIRDNEIALVKRVYEDGREEIIKKIENKRDPEKKRLTRTFTIGGFYKIVVLDKAGNESMIEFSISEKENAIPVSLSAIHNVTGE